MKLILVLPAAGLLFTGAVQPAKLPLATAALQCAHTEVTATKPSATMWTDKVSLRKGQVFTLYFAQPHPKYLGVIDPDGNFFYVVFPAEYSVGELKPFVSSEEFLQLNTLKINPATFKADPYRHGIWKNQLVFTKSGTYRFLLGDNLHVDDESAVTILKIKYKHLPRRQVPKADIAAI